MPHRGWNQVPFFLNDSVCLRTQSADRHRGLNQAGNKICELRIYLAVVETIVVAVPA